MPPSKIFIVPYRARETHKFFFDKYMSFILEDHDSNDYEIYFSHQTDKRKFNRGAVKNIGFLALKDKYPEHYKDITFIFNDVDTIPYNKNILTYETTAGTITHHYGTDFSLGGIVVIKGADFENINGFPNFWDWGLEDNCLHERALKKHLKINRDIFYTIGDKHILQLFDGITRDFNLNNINRSSKDSGHDGLTTLSDITYHFEDEFIQITGFNAPLKEQETGVIRYDIRNGKTIRKKDYLPTRPKLGMVFR